MSEYYELSARGEAPVLLAEMKDYIKLSSSMDDDLISSMLDASTTWGERYTGREFRANSWRLLIDDFCDRIKISRDPVNIVTNISRLVSGQDVTVPSITYYLKKGNQSSQIIISVNQVWPDDADEQEHSIKILFDTIPYDDIEAIKTGIKRTVSFWYQNRGDCNDCAAASKGSGVTGIYDQFRIVRI